MAAVCPAAVWAECTKNLGSKDSSYTEKKGAPRNRGALFVFGHDAESHAQSRVRGEKRNRTIQKTGRVAGRAPRAVGARGEDGFPALRAGLNCAAPTELNSICRGAETVVSTIEIHRVSVRGWMKVMSD